MKGFLQSAGIALSFVSGIAFAEVDASRIASVDANATEILMGFSLADKLVAVDVTSQGLLPDAGLPDLGYHRALSAEGLLSSEPTLIIGSTHMGPAPVIETLASTDIPLIQLDAATTVEGLISNILTLGESLQHSTEADTLVAEVKRQMDAINEEMGGEPLSMVFLLNMSGRGLSKAGSGTTGEALISIMGGNNLSDYAGYKSLSMEALLELDPDVILVGNGDPKSDAAQDLLAENPLLAHSSAVKSNRLLNVDAGKMVAGVSLGVMTEAQRLAQLVY